MQSAEKHLDGQRVGCAASVLRRGKYERRRTVVTPSFFMRFCADRTTPRTSTDSSLAASSSTVSSARSSNGSVRCSPASCPASLHAAAERLDVVIAACSTWMRRSLGLGSSVMM